MRIIPGFRGSILLNTSLLPSFYVLIEPSFWCCHLVCWALPLFRASVVQLGREVITRSTMERIHVVYREAQQSICATSSIPSFSSFSPYSSQGSDWARCNSRWTGYYYFTRYERGISRRREVRERAQGHEKMELSIYGWCSYGSSCGLFSPIITPFLVVMNR